MTQIFGGRDIVLTCGVAVVFGGVLVSIARPVGGVHGGLLMHGGRA